MAADHRFLAHTAKAQVGAFGTASVRLVAPQSLFEAMRAHSARAHRAPANTNPALAATAANGNGETPQDNAA